MKYIENNRGAIALIIMFVLIVIGMSTFIVQDAKHYVKSSQQIQQTLKRVDPNE